MLNVPLLFLCLCRSWWMCCDNRQQQKACASSPNSSWQQPQSFYRIGRDSRRHTDLFNAVSLNTLSCATHNADTNRKSLSVCLKSVVVKMFWASLTIKPACISAPHWLDTADCGISCECEACLQRAGGKCCHPIGRHGSLTVYKILWHLHT